MKRRGWRRFADDGLRAASAVAENLALYGSTSKRPKR
jgi:hypothetical protein